MCTLPVASNQWLSAKWVSWSWAIFEGPPCSIPQGHHDTFDLWLPALYHRHQSWWQCRMPSTLVPAWAVGHHTVQWMWAACSGAALYSMVHFIIIKADWLIDMYALTYLMGTLWSLAESVFFPHDQSFQKLLTFFCNDDQSRKIYNSFYNSVHIWCNLQAMYWHLLAYLSFWWSGPC